MQFIRQSFSVRSEIKCIFCVVFNIAAGSVALATNVMKAPSDCLTATLLRSSASSWLRSGMSIFDLIDE